MKRTDFLKRIVGLPVLATLAATLPEDKEEVQFSQTAEPELLKPFGLMCFYASGPYYQLGQEITSDLGDKAIIVARSTYPPLEGWYQYIFNPKIRDQFRYTDWTKFKV